MVRFGLLSYTGTDNLGDEVQSLAAATHLPRIDGFVDRDNPAQAQPLPTSVIMNGWYGQYPERWPPPEWLNPLFLSMHISQETVSSNVGLRCSEAFLTPASAAYLGQFAPIGARDKATLGLLQKAGIESYFSGCLTLTLVRPAVDRISDLVVVNDVPKEVLSHVRGQASGRVFQISHLGCKNRDPALRMDRARECLDMYARASCVVTSRLHCALPCLAMGTPVLMIDVAGDQYRFSGLHDLLWHCRPGQFVSGLYPYDVTNPPANMDAYLALRSDLQRRVSDFIDAAECDANKPQKAFSHRERLQSLVQAYELKGWSAPSYFASQATVLRRSLNTAATLLNPMHNTASGTMLSGDLTSGEGDYLECINPILNGANRLDGKWLFHKDHWSRVSDMSAA